MIEILNLRKTVNGYLINGCIESDGSEQEVKDWIKAKKEILPQYTTEEIVQQEKIQKKIDFNKWWEALTIEINTHVYSIKEKSLNRIGLVKSALADNEKVSWQEDWAIFPTNKLELQQVFNEANDLIQAKRVEVFGGIAE